MKTEFEIPVNGVETWTVVVEQEENGEYIAHCRRSTYVIGEGATQEDALEDFHHKCFVAPQIEAKRIHNHRVAAFGRFMAKIRLTPRFIK